MWEAVGVLILTASFISFYFLPSIVIATKIHPEKTPVMLLNIFLGWTLIGWLVALVMALSNRGAAEVLSAHQTALLSLRRKHERELESLKRRHRARLDTIRSHASSPPSQAEELETLKSEYEERIRQIESEHQRTLSELQHRAAVDATAQGNATPPQQIQSVETEYTGEPLYVVVPGQFQRVVAETLGRRFADQQVEVASDAGGRGIDLVLFESGGNQSRPLAIVQCKLQSHDDAIGYGDVSHLRGSMSLHGAERAYLITTGDFSDDAREMIVSGNPQNQVFLIDGMIFNQWRTQAGLAPVHYLSLAG